jgi:hypothetical protein
MNAQSTPLPQPRSLNGGKGIRTIHKLYSPEEKKTAPCGLFFLSESNFRAI